MGLWAKRGNPHEQWTLTTEFRAAGAGGAGGSLHIWYTGNGARAGVGASQGVDTIYTSKPWDGLALVIDSHTGQGQVRGYLNDGRQDYSHHHNPTSLAFAHCDFDYRNKGVLSQVKLTRDKWYLTVEVDGKLCFQIDKVPLPKGYFFGITAATSDIPDSFELFKFLTEAPPRNEGHADGHIDLKDQQQQHGQQNQGQQNQGQQQQGGAAQPDPAHEPQMPGAAGGKSFGEWKMEPGEEDHEAAFYKSQEAQFADLHNRLQALTHHLAAVQEKLGIMHDRIDALHKKEDEWRQKDEERRREDEKWRQKDGERRREDEKWRQEVRSHRVALEQLNRMESQLSILPDAVGKALTSSSPMIGMMEAVLVIIQVVLAGSYVLYKRRRNTSSKKYL